MKEGRHLKTLESTPKVVWSFGAARSGKTTLGQFANFNKWIDHHDEPSTILRLFVNSYLDKASSVLHKDIFKYILSEFFLDSILMRQANFRYLDKSSQFRSKSIFKIISRIHQAQNRDDGFRLMEDKSYIVWLTLTDLNNLSSLCKKIHKNSISIICLRDPLEVAHAVANKGWFSDEGLLKLRDNMPMKRIGPNRFPVPWMIKDEYCSDFINSDVIARGLIYWLSVHSNSKNKPLFLLEDFDHVFYFKDLIHNRKEIVMALEDLLGKQISFKKIRFKKREHGVSNELPTNLTVISQKYFEFINPIVEEFEIQKT